MRMRARVILLRACVLLLALCLFENTAALSGTVTSCTPIYGCPIAYEILYVSCSDGYGTLLTCCQDGCYVVNWWSCSPGNTSAECHRWDFCGGYLDDQYIFC
jgi:hypothetical protein